MLAVRCAAALGLAVAFVADTTGCASITAARRTEQEPIQVVLSAERPATLSVALKPPLGGGLQLADLWWLGAEAWLIGNLARVWTEHPSEQAASAAALMWGGGLTLADLLVRISFSSVVPRGFKVFWEKPDGEPVEVWQAVDAGEFEREGGTTVSVEAPADAAGRPVRVEVFGPAGRPIARARLARGVAAPRRAERAARRALPRLSVSATLVDELGERLVRGGELSHLEVTVHNTGAADAEGVVVSAESRPRVPGFNVRSPLTIGVVRAGQLRTVRLPIKTDGALEDGTVAVTLNAEDRDGVDAAPLRVSLDARKLRPVELAVDQHVVMVADASRRPRRGEQVQVQARVVNVGEVPARDVTVRLALQHPDLLALEDEDVRLDALAPGEASIVKLTCFIKSRYSGPEELPVALVVSERHGGPPRSHAVALQLDPADAVLREVAIAPAARPVREAGTLLADVDRPLARPVRPNPLAVGLVVGVERYNRSLPGVPWAGRDAQAVARYFQDVLGVPADQLVVLTDDQATLTGLEVALAEALPARIQPGESHLYVYFAGHGTPDPAGGSPYLVPFDGQLTSPAKTCLATARLYQDLVALRARQATVFLDACFTGSTGRDLEPKPLLADARPVVVASLDGALPKGVRVLTASGPGEVSSSHPEARHGLFTYFLLKALRREEAPFDASLRLTDLEAYLRQHVGREAIRLNRSQQPRLLGEQTAGADLLP